MIVAHLTFGKMLRRQAAYTIRPRVGIEPLEPDAAAFGRHGRPRGLGPTRILP